MKATLRKNEVQLRTIFPLVELISNPDEPWLEKWARLWRYQQSLPLIKHLLRTKDQITLLDIGCGQAAQYYQYLKFHFPTDIYKIDYLGIDPLVKAQKHRANEVKVLAETYESFCQKTTTAFDLITAFAVLEHVNQPNKLIKMLAGLLKKDGYVLGTTPSHFSKPILEFLAHGLGIISAREIAEHKQYFNRRELSKLLHEVGKNSVTSGYHTYFEWGLNNLFVLKKKS